MMSGQGIFEFLLYSIAIFVSTNLDDIFILVLFFSEGKFKIKDILTGQLLGIGILVVLSILAALIGLIVPTYYLGFLGLFPIYLGISGLIKLFNTSKEDTDQTPALKSYAYQFMFIMFITMANGGDNIGIYVPIFSRLSWLPILIMVLVFTGMTLLWSLLASYLTSHPNLANPIRKLSTWTTPFLLIFLGIYILYENQSITMLLQYIK